MGCGDCICFSFEYNANVVIPFLMMVFEIYIIIQACATPIDGLIVRSNDFIEEDNNIFYVATFIEESSCALVGELYLFRRLFLTTVACVNPLVLWCNHESQFPNIGFFAKYILGIPIPQIETKCVFSLVDVLIILRCCKL